MSGLEEKAQMIRDAYAKHKELAAKIEKLEEEAKALRRLDSEQCKVIYDLLPVKAKSLTADGTTHSFVARESEDGTTTYFVRGKKKEPGFSI